MARMRGRDLATLGALGAAALLLKGKGKGEGKAEVGAGPQEYKDIKGIPTGRLGEGINPETGDKYKTLPSDQEVQDIQEGPAGRSAARKVARARPSPASDAEFMNQDLQEGPASRSPIAEGVTATGTSREARGSIDPNFLRRKQNEKFGTLGRMRKGGSVKKYASGGSVSSASKRADGCAVKGKTRGKMV